MSMSKRLKNCMEVLAFLKTSAVRELHRYDVSDHSRESQYPFPFGLWFRGQSNKEWHLEPAAFRLPAPDESNMFLHFQLRAPEHRGNYRSIFDWLCLMQHFELPTRLLDWSESVLVALYFATQEEFDHDARIYILNARKLNLLANEKQDLCREAANINSPSSVNAVVRAQLAPARSFSDWQNRLQSVSDQETWRTELVRGIVPDGGDFSSPVAVMPNRLNGRMMAQSSCFTLHGGKCYPSGTSRNDSFLPEPKSLESLSRPCPTDQQFLTYFDIPSDKKADFQKELMLLGIHSGSLYPELDKQANYIKHFWKLT